MTLAKISPGNIYLKLFGGAYFHWRSLKACNIAKRTCLNYVWPGYISMKLLFTDKILRLFRARISKNVKCRFTLKRQKQPPEVSCKKRCSYRKRDSSTGVFLRILKNLYECLFVQNTSWPLLLSVRDIIMIYSHS